MSVASGTMVNGASDKLVSAAIAADQDTNIDGIPSEMRGEACGVVGPHAVENKSKRDRVEAFTKRGLSTLATSMGRRHAAVMEKAAVAVEYGKGIGLSDYCYVVLLKPDYASALRDVMGPSPMWSQVFALPFEAFKSMPELHKAYIAEVAKNVYHITESGALSFKDYAAAAVHTYPTHWFGAGFVDAFSGVGFPKSLTISYPRWRARVGSGAARATRVYERFSAGFVREGGYGSHGVGDPTVASDRVHGAVRPKITASVTVDASVGGAAIDWQSAIQPGVFSAVLAVVIYRMCKRGRLCQTVDACFWVALAWLTSYTATFVVKVVMKSMMWAVYGLYPLVTGAFWLSRAMFGLLPTHLLLASYGLICLAVYRSYKG